MRSPPLRRTSPRLGATIPSSTRTSVVLPAPLGPISVTISPAATSMATSYRRLRPLWLSRMRRAPISSRRGDGAARRLVPTAGASTSPFQAAGSLGWGWCPPESALDGGWRSRPSMFRLLRCPGTIGAQAPNLHHRLLRRKGRELGRSIDGLEHGIPVHLRHRSAALARSEEHTSELQSLR